MTGKEVRAEIDRVDALIKEFKSQRERIQQEECPHDSYVGGSDEYAHCSHCDVFLAFTQGQAWPPKDHYTRVPPGANKDKG